MRNTIISILGLSILSFLLFASCVQDIKYLKDKTMDLDAKIIALRQSEEKKLVPIREGQAEMVAEMDKVRAEIQDLSGRVADNRHLVKHFVERDTSEQDELNANLSNLNERVAELEAMVKRLYEYLNLGSKGKGLSMDPGQSPEKLKEIVPSSPSIEVLISQEKQLYDSMLAAYRSEQYEDAIAGFQGFLDKSPKSDLADNAQFWIAESYMALKQYEQAILAYQKVIKRYSKGNKVPNAMLRQALAFHEIKDKTSSRLLLKKLIKIYPNTAEAKIARAKLKELK